MQTSLKTGFAQIFSCRPKNLSCPKFGGAPAPIARPARTPMFPLNGKTSHPPPSTSPQKIKHGHCHYLQFIPQYILKRKSERLQFKNNTRIFSAQNRPRKTRISSPGRKNNILIKRKECTTNFGELIRYWIWGLLTIKI